MRVVCCVVDHVCEWITLISLISQPTVTQKNRKRIHGTINATSTALHNSLQLSQPHPHVLCDRHLARLSNAHSTNTQSTARLEILLANPKAPHTYLRLVGLVDLTALHQRLAR